MKGTEELDRLEIDLGLGLERLALVATDEPETGETVGEV